MMNITNIYMVFLRTIIFCALFFIFGCAKEVAPYELVLDENTTSGIVARGGIIVIKLKGNATTGFVWSVTKDGTPILQFKKEKYDGTDPKLIGSGGITTFTFNALKRGNAQIDFKYGRTWELSSEKTATFEITVK